MAKYLALTYTADVDWGAPEQAAALAEYVRFANEHSGQIISSAVLRPTSTAKVVRFNGGQGGEVVTTDGPYARTEEALTGYYLLEAESLDAAVALAAQIPAAWSGAVEVRPTGLGRD